MLANAINYKTTIIAPFIQKMADLGYIRQDSRDTTGPYDPGATYYTVPAKRAEIDQLFRDDKENRLIMIDNIDCFNADIDAKTLVCTECWTIHKKGAKFCRNCMRDLNEIDTQILDVILRLNQKGYPTLFCCSGHPSNVAGGAYFGINRIMEQENIPDGFTLNIEEGRSVYRSIPYGRRNVKKGQKTITKFERSTIERLVKEDIMNFRIWVERLPV